MSVLTGLGSVLQTAGVGTVGTNIFYAALPMTEPDNAIALVEYGGASPQWAYAVSHPSAQPGLRRRTHAA